MASSRAATAIGRLFAVDDPWDRPPPTPAEQRADIWLAAGFSLVAVVGQELLRGAGWFDEIPEGSRRPVWIELAAVLSATALLAGRRRWPLTIIALAIGHMILTGSLVPGVSYQFPVQVTYFFALYSGVAFARDRRLLTVIVGGALVAIVAWASLEFAVGNAVGSMLPDDLDDPGGVFSPLVSMVLYTMLVNAVYFGGAIWLGHTAWRRARDGAAMRGQAATIAGQAAQLRDQAVVEERLRIARELHDVVAHHVSVMGVQAAAARRQLAKDPQRAAEALGNVEQSSRDAVTQMRGLLGTLRTPEPTPADSDLGSPADPRAPHPGLAELPDLLDQVRSRGLDTRYHLVTPGQEATPAAAELQRVPPEIGLSIYRIVQEALANVSRHSTATSARVSIRVTAAHVEAEILDDGRPRGGTAGTGLGTLGIRERLASHGGTSEIGPRVTGGYRVRVRFPLAHRTGATESTERSDNTGSTGSPGSTGAGAGADAAAGMEHRPGGAREVAR